MDEATRKLLLETLDADEISITSVAREMVTSVPEMGPGRYDDRELEQLVNAFRAVVREALVGSGTETRDFVVESAIPALVIEDKQTPVSLAQSSAGFGVLLSTAVVRALPPQHQEAAARWLAEFFADYTRSVLEAAMTAQTGSG